jgi:hypothetical protein
VFAAAALTATGLVAAMLPATATALAADGTNPVAAISSSAGSLNPAAGEASPSTSADPTASADPSPTDVVTPSPSASSGGGGNPLAGLPIPIPSGNPLTGLTDCLSKAGSNPTAYAACLAAAGSGLPGADSPQGKAVVLFLACVQKSVTDRSAAEGEKCGTALFSGLGIPGADCLDPTLQPILTALDTLLGGDPSKLQGALQDLPNTLPGQLSELPNCLNPSTSSAPPSATPTPTTGGGGGISSSPTDPTEAVPVVANPTFTG